MTTGSISRWKCPATDGGSWMVFESEQMQRPLDEYGIPVDCGKTWYWAINRIGQIVGTGKFAWSIGNPQDPTFFINGTGYNPECFRYIPAAPPQFPGVCEHGVLSEHPGHELTFNERKRLPKSEIKA